jgi:RNase H-fold protein (predicted Holliday junction resolvase)
MGALFIAIEMASHANAPPLLSRLSRLAHGRLLAVDFGARYTGLALRTCRHAGAQPYALLERVLDNNHGRAPRQAAASSRGGGGGGSAETTTWMLRLDERQQRRRQQQQQNYLQQQQQQQNTTTRRLPPSSRFASQADALLAVVKAEGIAACVIGMPYLADGSRSRECAIVERHTQALQAEWARRNKGGDSRPLPMLFWDESFSTRRAVGAKRQAPGTRAARGSHAAAACIILEEVLEALAEQEAHVSDPFEPLLEEV